MLVHSLKIICSQIQQSLCTGEKVSWCLNSSTTERLPLVPREKASIRVLREKGNLGDVCEQAIRAGPFREVLAAEHPEVVERLGNESTLILESMPIIEPPQ